MTNCKRIHVVSFGYKHGEPPYADLLFNVRFIANPYHAPGMRELDGSHPDVQRFVLEQPCTQRFLPALEAMLRASLAEYIASSGPNYEDVYIAFGCAGGKQRSVALALFAADLIGTLLVDLPPQDRPQILVSHRDSDRP